MRTTVPRPRHGAAPWPVVVVVLAIVGLTLACSSSRGATEADVEPAGHLIYPGATETSRQVEAENVMHPIDGADRTRCFDVITTYRLDSAADDDSVVAWYADHVGSDGWQARSGNSDPAQITFSKQVGDRTHAMAVIGSTGDTYTVRYRINPRGLACPYNW